MNPKLLPRRPPPIWDELLSSWITRLAWANHCSLEEFCGYLGLQEGRVPEQEGDIEPVCMDRLCSALGKTKAEIASMTLPRLPQQSIQLIGLHDFQICKHCRAETPDLVLRHWRFAWTTNCGRCGRFLTSTYRQGGVTKRMQDRAIQGADRLRLAAAKGDQKQLRRFRLTLELLNEVGLVRSSALLSANQSERINALAAIDVGSRRPLLGIAYILKRNSWVVPVLWHAFPRHRRVLKKVLKRERIPLHSFPERRNESQTPKRQAPNPTLPAPSKAALGAARQAVEELGADADRYDLLLRAQEIWQSKAIEQSYPQPVEIS